MEVGENEISSAAVFDWPVDTLDYGIFRKLKHTCRQRSMRTFDLDVNRHLASSLNFYMQNFFFSFRHTRGVKPAVLLQPLPVCWLLVFPLPGEPSILWPFWRLGDSTLPERVERDALSAAALRRKPQPHLCWAQHGGHQPHQCSFHVLGEGKHNTQLSSYSGIFWMIFFISPIRRLSFLHCNIHNTARFRQE